MTKWADYLLSAVKYDKDRKIVQAMQHVDDGTKISAGQLVDRDTLTTNLKRGVSYSTIFGGRVWSVGRPVKLVRIGGEYAIRADLNKAPYDHLGPVSELG